MNLELCTVFTTGRSEKEPGHGFLEGDFLRNKFYKGEILCRGLVRACAHGRKGEEGTEQAATEEQARSSRLVGVPRACALELTYGICSPRGCPLGCIYIYAHRGGVSTGA